MTDNTRYCVLDYETYSEASLKHTGSYEYARHPTTEVLCVGFRIGTREQLPTAKTHVWSPDPRTRDGSMSVQLLLDAFQDPGTILIGHNVFFEHVITRYVLPRHCPTQSRYLTTVSSDRWCCTAALASPFALPRKLEGTAKVLRLPHQKDMEGHRLMLKMAKPRKPSKNDARTRHDDLDDLRRLMAYCAADVDTEVAAFLRFPPLHATERKIWELDQKMNWAGPLVDRPLVTTALKMIALEQKAIKRRVVEITDGALYAPTQRDALLRWLEENGTFLPDLKKKTVEDAITDGLVSGLPRELLELRLESAKTSTAKYTALEMRSRTDGRLRDILVYHRASTGRWGGTGAQLHNLPRPTLDDSIQAAETLALGDLEWVRALYGSPMKVLSSCLRSTLIAPEGKTFDVADFNAIEARVLFWLARHEGGLRAFREGRDLYREQAAKIYGVEPAAVTDDQRFYGKALILGAGFGLGHKKFREYCKGFGKEITESFAKLAIGSYRAENRPVVLLWSNLEKAAIAGVENLGKRFTVNRTTWWLKGRFLYCELPSGRRLAYCDPVVRYEPTPWGDKRPVLYHWGEDPKTKQWVNSKTYGGRLTENITQAVARDLMAAAMLRIDAAGPWQLVLTVHDEIVAEREAKADAGIGKFCRLMETVPDWAEGCPVKVAGWTGSRYRKG